MIQEKFKIRITKEKFLKDCSKFSTDEQNFGISYLEFLKYFKALKKITKHNLIVGINFTYGWMPTIFDFRSNNFISGVKILNKAKNGVLLSVDELDTLRKLFNNSMVGTSKILHFIKPTKFAILDGRVYRYLTGKEGYSYRIEDSQTYLHFLKFMADMTRGKEYNNVHTSICKKLGYNASKLRTAELIMYLNGRKRTKKASIS